MNDVALAEIEQTVTKLLTRELDQAELPATVTASGLMSDGAIDSLAMLEIVMKLEEIYGVSLDAFEVNPDNFDTIADIARLVHAKLPSSTEGSP